MTSNPLARLIDATREANEWSDYDIARRARNAGHQMSKSTISDIRTKGVVTIVPDKVRALAVGLELPVSEVLRAMLETVGLPAGSSSSSPEQAIRRDPDMPALAKRQLLAMIRQVRSDRDESPADLSPARRKAILQRVTEDSYSERGAASSEGGVADDAIRTAEGIRGERHSEDVAESLDRPEEPE